jgi:hypothetical protein
MAVPYTFGTATAAIPLSQLDSNFSTTITLGNTAIQLGNTVTTLNNMTLANVTVSSGNVTTANITTANITTANVTTANITTSTIATLTTTNGASIQGLTVGKGNSAVGNNTAIGVSTLAVNTTGSDNTAVGNSALALNTVGATNQAFGSGALASNTTGNSNNAFGSRALTSNTTGNANVAMGRDAGAANTSSTGNTGIGRLALSTVTTGSNNTGLGRNAGTNLQTTTIAATAIVNGTSYQIVTMGTTTSAQWIASGAVTGTVGETFTANATPGVGTGTVATSADVTALCQANTLIGYNSGSAMTIGSNNVIIGGYTGSASPISSTGNAYVVLSDGAGNVVVSTKTSQTFALQGGTLSSGTGIAFPATQSASADANTLDDYEEGTWTPIDSSGAGLSFTSVSGTYVKIGSLCYITGALTFPTTASAADATIGGLPFSPNSATAYNNYGPPIRNNKTLSIQPYGINNTTFLILQLGNYTTYVSNVALTAGTILFSFTYRTA